MSHYFAVTENQDILHDWKEFYFQRKYTVGFIQCRGFGRQVQQEDNSILMLTI